MVIQQSQLLEISRLLLDRCEQIGSVVQGQVVLGSGIDFGRGDYLLAGDDHEIRLYADSEHWEEVPPLVIPPSRPVWR